MNQVQKLSQYVLLVTESGEGNYIGAQAESVVARAEEDIGLTFPHSYRTLLRTFGSWDLASDEYFGVGVRKGGYLDVVKRSRELLEMGVRGAIAVSVEGDGSLVFLDASDAVDGEYSVRLYDPALGFHKSEKMSRSFIEFAWSRAVANGLIDEARD